MKAGQKVLRVAAVLCSLALVGGYVYERAGGGLLSRARDSRRDLLPGSKAKTHLIPPTAGPRDDVGSAPDLFEADTPVDQLSEASSGLRALLPGSKSPGVVFGETTVKSASPLVPKGVPFDPFADPPPNAVSPILPAAQQARTKRPRSPQAKSSRHAPDDPFGVRTRAMLPGSKSAVVIRRDATPAPTNPPVNQRRTNDSLAERPNMNGVRPPNDSEPLPDSEDPFALSNTPAVGDTEQGDNDPFNP
jgi:hypothetical protein